MTVKLSKLYGMEIFTDGGKYVGTAQDFVIDLEGGEVARMLLEQFSSHKGKEILKEKSVLYKNVKSVEDVVVVARTH
ncbi:MAG: PRC-barrel domain-containing protein [Candidatus ainarchaeum sp.]|nr:PRC-barrel domain-containing protein [Candidatus ainarchaeum sp.]MDD5096242.1 PRC-barrel domain-containing protein [Candidatus ainarchaeum sp.]